MRKLFLTLALCASSSINCMNAEYQDTVIEMPSREAELIDYTNQSSENTPLLAKTNDADKMFNTDSTSKNIDNKKKCLMGCLEATICICATTGVTGLTYLIARVIGAFLNSL